MNLETAVLASEIEPLWFWEWGKYQKDINVCQCSVDHFVACHN